MKYSFLPTLTICALAAMPAAQAKPPAPYEIQEADFKTYTFEEGLPAEFSSTGGTVGVTERNFKTGKQSLEWTWNTPGAKLVYHQPEAFRHLTGEDPDPIVYEWITYTGLSTLDFWVYNPIPIQDALWFEIGTQDRTDVRFWMTLDFQGWQHFRAQYGRDMPGFPGPDADTLRIIAPSSLPAGTLSFDDFRPRTEQDVRFIKRTSHTPWVFNQEVSAADLDPIAYLRHGTGVKVEESPTLEIAMPETVPADVLADIELIQERYLGELTLPKPFDPTPAQLEQIEKAWAANGFSRSPEGVIIGSPEKLNRLWGEAERVCLAFQGCQNPETRQHLDAMLRDYSDFLVLYGGAAGYGFRNAFARPTLVMKPELKRFGIWEAMLAHLRKTVHMDDLYNPQAKSDADILNHTLTSRLNVLLFQDDPPALYRDLLALQAWLTTTAHHGSIRPDGSLHHHGQTYSGYNLPALPALVDVNVLLYGTRFYAAESHRMARRIAYAIHEYSCTVDIPTTLGGRHQAKATLTWGFADIYRKLAGLSCPVEKPFLSRPAGGTPTDTPGLPANSDREMAEVYLYYADVFGETSEAVERFRALGIQPHDPTGHLSLNHTVAAVHRRDNWMVFFRGQRSPYLTGENYLGTTSAMGRYQNFGLMEIVSAGDPPNITDSSLATPPKGTEAGWDFNFYPGTTARTIPLDALTSHFPIDERWTTETFALGTSLDGNGIFGMKLQEDLPGYGDPMRIGPTKYWLGQKKYDELIRHAQFDPAFRARKSIFCFDDRIVCLGSGIRSSDTNAPVRTTLFQHLLNAEQKAAQPFPEHRTLAAGASGVLIDRNGNGYYVAVGNDASAYSRAHRDLPYRAVWNPLKPDEDQPIQENSGDTELAFLDHGPAPEGAGYEYCVVIRAGQDRMQAFAESMADPERRPYQVLRRDDAAHVVQDRESGTIGYVFFEAGQSSIINHQSSILSTSRPCVAMLRPTANDGLHLSVCEPTIGEGNVWVNLVLSGSWQPSGPTPEGLSVTALDNSTLLSIPCRDAVPVTLNLTAR